MLSSPDSPKLRRRPPSWPWVVAVLLAIQAALSITLKQGAKLDAYCETSYFLLLLFASVLATQNAARNRGTIRLFWSFLAVSFALWALVPWAWFYYSVLQSRAPVFLFETFPSFLHIVMLIAAVISRPHVKLPSRRPYRTTLNFLVLLFVWVFAYAYFLFPYQYGSRAGETILRYEGFYLAENLLLLILLGLLTLRAESRWKLIYGHLLGASALYALGSLAANLVWASGNLYGGLIGLPFTASIGWFVWIGLDGRKQARQLSQRVQLDTANITYSSLLANLAVVAVPGVGLWEVFRIDELPWVHEIRLFLVLIAVVLLAVAAFVHDYLSNREFSSDVAVAHDRLRSALESGRAVGWEWDVSTGEGLWFGDLQSMFGTTARAEVRNVEDFFGRIAEEDRPTLERAIAGANLSGNVYSAEFRVVRPDGTVRWFAARGQCYYAQNGRPQRVFGMAADITERKQVQEVIRENEERFRLVANTAPVLIWMSGIDTLCTYVNDPWLEFTGRPLAAELGNGWAKGVHPDDVEDSFRIFTGAGERRERFKLEYRLRRYDGEYRWLVCTGVPRFNLDGSFAGFIGSCIDITERKLGEEALSTVSRRLIEAQEQERTRIARELHDDISQRLALLILETERLRLHPSASAADSGGRIQEIITRARGISNDVHGISHRLHSSQLEYLGIGLAAEGFCRELSEQRNVIVDLACEDLPTTVPKDVSLCLFRILQESLNNAVKYSGVKRFSVRLAGVSDGIHLRVIDSGVGFDSESALNGRGLGLVSMRERVGLVKGKISIVGRVTGGTEINVWAPVNSAGQERVGAGSSAHQERAQSG